MVFYFAGNAILGWRVCTLLNFTPVRKVNNYFKSRLSLIVRVNVVLNRTVVVDST